MSDIVERLRIFAKMDPDQAEAADEIERLRAENERLRRNIYDLLDDGDETDRAAARAALGEEKK